MKRLVVLLGLVLLPCAVFAQSEIQDLQVIEGSTGIAVPVDPLAAPLLPDLPLEQAVTEAVTPRFVMEHRSALNEKKVTVRGTVVYVLLGDKACPPDRGMCAQPRVTLADSGDAARDAGYDLTVLLPEGDTAVYEIGQVAELTGTVSASAAGAVMRRE